MKPARLLLLLVSFVIGILGSPLTPGTPPPPDAIVVTARIYSTRADPMWTVKPSDPAGVAIMKEITALADKKDAKNPLNFDEYQQALTNGPKRMLSYRGFWVQAKDVLYGVSPGTFETFKGIDADQGTIRLLNTESAEKALLASAPKETQTLIQQHITDGIQAEAERNKKGPSDPKPLPDTVKAKIAQAAPEITKKIKSVVKKGLFLEVGAARSKHLAKSTFRNRRSVSGGPARPYDWHDWDIGLFGRGYAKMSCNNCYSFANNVRNNKFSQPGYNKNVAVCENNPTDCLSAAVADGLININDQWMEYAMANRGDYNFGEYCETMAAEQARAGVTAWCVILFYNHKRGDDADFHWMRYEGRSRRNSRHKWVHKPGMDSPIIVKGADPTDSVRGYSFGGLMLSHSTVNIDGPYRAARCQ